MAMQNSRQGIVKRVTSYQSLLHYNFQTKPKSWVLNWVEAKGKSHAKHRDKSVAIFGE